MLGVVRAISIAARKSASLETSMANAVRAPSAAPTPSPRATHASTGRGRRLLRSGCRPRRPHHACQRHLRLRRRCRFRQRRRHRSQTRKWERRHPRLPVKPIPPASQRERRSPSHSIEAGARGTDCRRLWLSHHKTKRSLHQRNSNRGAGFEATSGMRLRNAFRPVDWNNARPRRSPNDSLSTPVRVPNPSLRPRPAAFRACCTSH